MAKKLACEEAAEELFADYMPRKVWHKGALQTNHNEYRVNLSERLRAEARELKARRKNEMPLEHMRELKRLRRLILSITADGDTYKAHRDAEREAARIQKEKGK